MKKKIINKRIKNNFKSSINFWGDLIFVIFIICSIICFIYDLCYKHQDLTWQRISIDFFNDISLAYITSYLFYIFTERIPTYKKRKIAENTLYPSIKLIINKIAYIGLFKELYYKLNKYSLEDQFIIYDKNYYFSVICENEYGSGYFFNIFEEWISLAKLIKKTINEIISNDLFSYLDNEIIEEINLIANSTFLNEIIKDNINLTILFDLNKFALDKINKNVLNEFINYGKKLSKLLNYSLVLHAESMNKKEISHFFGDVQKNSESLIKENREYYKRFSDEFNKVGAINMPDFKFDYFLNDEINMNNGN